MDCSQFETHQWISQTSNFVIASWITSKAHQKSPLEISESIFENTKSGEPDLLVDIIKKWSFSNTQARKLVPYGSRSVSKTLAGIR